MKPRTIALDIDTWELGQEILHTLAMLEGYLFLHDQVTVFEPFVQEWLQLLQAEVALDRESRRAEAVIIVVDEKLDLLCVNIDSGLRAEFGNDRKHPEYQRYFKNVRPSDLRRPVLGQQLEVMRMWPPSLATSPSMALREYGTQLAQFVVEADQSVSMQSEAQRKVDDFLLRTRKQFIDRLNAARLALYGKLAEMPHKYPERKLDGSFTMHFFIRGTNNRKPTLADLERDILRLRTRLQKKELQFQKLLEQQAREQKMREEAEYAELMRELAEAERLQAEAEARIEALQERMRDHTDTDTDMDDPNTDDPDTGDQDD